MYVYQHEAAIMALHERHTAQLEASEAIQESKQKVLQDRVAELERANAAAAAQHEAAIKALQDRHATELAEAIQQAAVPVLQGRAAELAARVPTHTHTHCPLCFSVLAFCLPRL